MANDNIQSIEDFDPDVPPFAQFRDWCTVLGVDDAWALWNADGENEWRTPRQIEIVETNLAAYADLGSLQERMNRLGEYFDRIPDETIRQRIRSLYCFHLSGNRWEKEDFDLSYIRCPCDVSLSGAEVGGKVSLNGAEIGGDVWLSGAKVGGDVWLRGAEVGGDVWLSGAKVGGDVWLRGAEVGGDVSLDEAEVGGDVWLRGAEVGGDVSLLDINLSETTSMPASGMEVEGSLFVRGHFPEEVNFEGLRVGGTAWFSNCTFLQIPDFRDAIFERPPEVANMKVPEPVFERGKIWPYRTAVDKDDVAKLRKLKAMALAANDHEKDGEFFAKEMMAKRGVETTSFAGLFFNSVYWTLSEFGQSFMRPLAWLGVSLAFFTALYAALASRGVEFLDALEFGALHAAKNLMPIISTLVRFGGKPEGYKSVYDKRFGELLTSDAPVGWIVVLSYGQAFFGTVLLFLLLLALRNKFRLK